MSKKSTALAVTSSVPTILEKLDAEIASLKHIQETQYKTSGLVEGFNIKNETLLANLVRVASIILAKKTAYDNGADWLGLQEYPVFEIGGYSIEDYKSDIILRKAVIEHKDTLETLNGFKADMAKFLSEEDQKAMLFAKMEAFLKK